MRRTALGEHEGGGLLQSMVQAKYQNLDSRRSASLQEIQVDQARRQEFVAPVP